MRRDKKDENKKIAAERIEILKNMIEKHPEFSKRYMELIKKLKSKYRMS